MDRAEIKGYLDELEKLLRRYSFKQPDIAVARIIASIRENILSLIKIWDNTELRKAVLITGLEEGLFYEPPVKLDIRAFVVVAIRNSLIEDLASYDTGNLGMTKPIGEGDIKEITRHAVAYFAKIDLGKLAGVLAPEIKENYYADILDEYRVAKAALINLAKYNRKVIEYSPVQSRFGNDFVFSVSNGESVYKTHDGNAHLVTTSGISPHIDHKLRDRLMMLYNGEVGLVYFDCFKMLTRNFEKLLRVLEFVLVNDGLFVTANYIIGNGHLEKRTNLIRAAHGMAEMEKNLQNYKGISKKHMNILKSVASQMGI